MTNVVEVAGAVHEEMSRMDRAIYGAVANTPTPYLDDGLRDLTKAANKSLLWLTVAGGLAVFGGAKEKRAALTGVASIAAASMLVNAGVKMIARRDRPDRQPNADDRFVPMPTSTSFPSGHSASAFAFAQGVSAVAPTLSVPLHLAAGAVAYSRVHTGVHYPGDVVAGSLIGIVTGGTVSRILNGRPGRSRNPSA